MKISILSLFLFFSFYGNSQLIGEYIWPKTSVSNIPDSLSEEDAVFLSNVRTYDFMGNGEMNIIVYQRIYINSDLAVEECSDRSFYLAERGSMAMLNARTVKKNGQIIPLTKKDYKRTESVVKGKFDETIETRHQLLYPDVQVGDVLEIAYQYDLPTFIFSNKMYLEGELTSLYSRITLRNMSVLDMTLFRLNGMPQVQSKSDGNGKIMTWEKSGVEKLLVDGFNAFPPDAPHFVYNLWGIGENLDYKAFYDYETRSIPQSNNELWKVSTIFLKMGAFSEDDHPLIKIQKTVRLIEDEFTWDNSSVQEGEYRAKLNDKKMNYALFGRAMIKLIRELGYRVERGFTKGRLNGEFVHGMMSLEQMRKSYYAIVEDNGAVHFIFAPRDENEYYYLDEIPFFAEGNQSIGLYGNGMSLLETSKIALPESTQKDNLHMVRTKMKFHTEGDSILLVFDRKDICKGHNSFLTRKKALGEYWRDDFKIPKDLEPKEIKNVYPYKSTFEFSDTIANAVVPMDDSSYWVSLQHMFPEGIFLADETEDVLNDYLILPFKRTSSFSIFLEAPESIQLLEEKKVVEYKNDIGNVSYSVAAVGEKMLKINLKFTVLQREISGERNVKMYKDLLQNYAEIKDKKWLVSFR